MLFKAVFESAFSFSYILFFVASAVYYNKICKIAINVIGDLSEWSLQ